MITLQQYMADVQTYLDSLRGELKATTHVSLPAIVTKFDAQKQTISCIPTIKELIYINGSVSFKEFPELQEVPIEVPRAGNFAITLPISVGQECRVTFQDLCLDGWWSRGGIQSWNDLRRHDLSDAIATFSPWSQPNVISDYSTSNLEIRSLDNTTKISVADDSILAMRNTSTVTIDDVGITVSKNMLSNVIVTDAGITVSKDGVSNVIVTDAAVTITQGDQASILINSAEIHLQVGSNAIIINASGIELTTPNLTVGGSSYQNHTHPYVWTDPAGSGNTGPVNP